MRSATRHHGRTHEFLWCRAWVLRLGRDAFAARTQEGASAADGSEPRARHAPDPRPVQALSLRLASVLVLIVISAGVSMLNPFLIRDALDDGLFKHNGTLLTDCVLGMIGVAIFSNAAGVWQTYMSNVVGQRVMHDLRAAVYQRLQRMSLAFFTRTRTGEVQSRIANDIGGLESVVTTTATTIASERHDGAGRARGHAPARLAAGPDLARVRAALGLPDPPRGSGAAADHHRAAATAGRSERAGVGVAVGLRDPARQDDGAGPGPRRSVHRASRSRSPSSRSAHVWPAAG